MKFDFCIGNPPYQADIENQGDRANPVYDKFMDAAYDVANCVELIHPARFLFNAGQTAKSWNQKMLNDEHLKVLHYEEDASKVFSNTDIKGGVAITIHNNEANYGAIKIFTAYKELNSIVQKVNAEDYLNTIVSARGLYRFSDAFYEAFPKAKKMVGAGSGNMIVSNIFEKMSKAFHIRKPADGEYVAILGRIDNRRIIKYLKREYLIPNEYVDKYKVMLAEANGTGRFGEKLSSPFVAPPNQGATDTFISIGILETEYEANSLLEYIKTKFCRAMLGVNKVTQHNPKSVWKSIPLQDFTTNSDINWDVSTRNIDKQLYKKYRLTKEEIDFIETHVKEME